MTEYTRENMPDIEAFLKRLSYDPDTGSIKWKDRPESDFTTRTNFLRFRKLYLGREAGTTTVKNNYPKIILFEKRYQKHRVAWAMHHGSWPKGIIDHINGDITDNRIKNLRDCSYSDNCRNAKKYKSNSSGLSGVSWHKASGKWVAQITLGGKRTHLGLFSDKNEAYEAWRGAKTENNFTESHGVRS